MAQRLADRLNAARRRQFVGRTTELTVFQAALESPAWPFVLVFVYGPGGVGKTALLAEYQRRCQAAGIDIIHLDARNIEPTPETLTGALRAALNAGPDESPPLVLAQRQRRQVLMLDTCENLAALDTWLRETFLPELPDNVLVVMASRQPLDPAWRADPGWQALVHVVALRNLSPEESRALLALRGIPAAECPAVLNFTHGHPLALALVADVFQQREGQHFQPEATPDVVKTLLERFVQKVPSPAHRAALEACSLVRTTTEGLLGTLLALAEVEGSPAPAAHELFEWLRGLSFIEAGPFGVYPHDLAREALAADVRWRNPDWYNELHRRARVSYVARLQRTVGAAQQAILFDLIFLHRDNAVVRPVFEWQSGGHLRTDALADGDPPALLACADRHEGPAAAQLLAFWLARQPHNVLVIRDATPQPAGFVMELALNAVTAEEREHDPAVRACWEHLQRHAPLRPGEVATLFRFWMARDTYQAVSPVQSLIFVTAVRHYLTTPGLAYTFFPCAEPDFWAGVFAYADLHRLPAADFEVGGRRYGAYGHDWRATPPSSWMTLLAEREVAAETAAAASPSAGALIVLSEAAFGEAVRAVLQDFTQPELIRGNPLLRSRAVVERAGAQADEGARIATLTAMILELAVALQASPREARLYRALETTYFRPVGTQEQAAEALDQPFSTYRRHLKAGVQRIVDALWQREIGLDR